MKHIGMKISLWSDYGALNSIPVFDAFKHSLVSNGWTVTHNDPSADVNVIWSVLFHGRMARNKEVWEQNKPTIVLEVGGIKRGTTWKVGLNGINRDAYFGPKGNDNSRAKKLGLELKPWRTSGEHILICGQHHKSLQWKNMPAMSTWITETIQTIKQHTNLPIIFRAHPRSPLPEIEREFSNVYREIPKKIPETYDDFDMSFKGAWATVNWSSNPGVHSILEGVPSFTGPSSLAWDVSNKELEAINEPVLPDRQQWLNDYAYTEYTLDEISQGMPLKHLTSKLI